MNQFCYKDIYTEGDRRVLEVNILPEKYCNFDCIFCPIGRSTNKTDMQVIFDDIKDSLAELEIKIKQTNANLVFINSAGEAFIHSQIDIIIHFIKKMGLPVRLLSNGYLLGQKNYMDIANQCDEVIGELKAVTEDTFKKIQRPINGYTLETYINNMIRFKKQFKGKFLFEITIIRGYNDDIASAQKLKEIIKVISSDELMIVRLEEEKFQKSLGITDEKFSKIKNSLLVQ